MPGVFHFSVDRLEEELSELVDLGIPAVIVFGVPSKKDAVGSEAYSEQGIVQRAVRRIKELIPTCGHRRHLSLSVYGSRPLRRGEGRRDRQRRVLGIVGADGGFPGAGRGRHHRPFQHDGRFCPRHTEGLDEAGFEYTPILSYAVKYASSFYGPFREAATRPLNSATVGPIRWIRPTPGKPCGRRPPMWRRERTS